MNSLTSFYRQKGAVLPLLAIGMLAILGVAGLAIDTGHGHLNKSRLQNALDAAALSGAKTLMSSESTVLATLNARDAFEAHVEGELSDLDPNALVVRFATALAGPYGAGSADSNFVRVGFTGFETAFTFASLLPGVGTDTQIGGTALAGPIPIGTEEGAELCDVAPLLMCGDPDLADYGLTPGAEVEYQLKTGSDGNGGGNGGGPAPPDPDPSTNDVSCSQGCSAEFGCLPSSEVDENGDPVDEGIGPGNFQLARISCPGGNCVREALAGADGRCLTETSTVPTEPGNTVGPVIQGLSTRFGEYLGGMSAADYPPDAVTTNRCTVPGADYWYEDYLADSGGAPPAGTLALRRVIAVPIVACDGEDNGASDLEVLDFGCFFLTRNMPIQGGQDNYIYGQFVEKCEVSGVTGEDPDPVINNEFSTYEIVLYNDPAPES